MDSGRPLSSQQLAAVHAVVHLRNHVLSLVDARPRSSPSSHRRAIRASRSTHSRRSWLRSSTIPSICATSPLPSSTSPSAASSSSKSIRKIACSACFHDKDYNFILQKDRPQWATLKPHEQVLLNGIFSAGTVGRNRFHGQPAESLLQKPARLKSRIFESLVSQGFYRRRPDSVRSAYVGGGIVVGILSIWGGVSRRFGFRDGRSAIHYWRNSFCRGRLRVSAGLCLRTRNRAPARSKMSSASRIFSITSNPIASIA